MATNLYEQMSGESRRVLASILGFAVDDNAPEAVLFRGWLREIPALPSGFKVRDVVKAYTNHVCSKLG